MRVKLANAVTTRKVKTVLIRETLYALRCDACKKVFAGKPFCTGEDFTKMHGIFDRCVTGADGQSFGNAFSADVCSFTCAHAIFAEDGWKKMKEYRAHVKAGARLVRAEVRLTSLVQNEEQLRREWGKIDETKTLVNVLRDSD